MKTAADYIAKELASASESLNRARRVLWSSAEAAAQNREATVRVGSGSMVRRFGTVVCQLRKARGLSGPKFAALAGIGKGHLWKIENEGENISLETIEKLAAALQVTPAILMTKCAAPNIVHEPHRGSPSPTE